jgi:hypothetical protein
VGPADVKHRAPLREAKRRRSIVTIKTLTGKIFEIKVDLAYRHGDLVIELKKLIHEREGLKPCQHRLVLGRDNKLGKDKKLRDFWRLREAGVRNRSVIYLLLVDCGC